MVRARVSAALMTAGCTFLALAGDASALQQAEATPGAGRLTVTAGHYGAGGVKRFFLGSGYRDVWMTPVSAEVLDLAREAGGLRPVGRVGGQQTKVLALVGADGRSYTFRGLVKDASHVLDHRRPAAQGLARREEHHRRPDVGPAPGERSRGARDPRSGRDPVPALAARRAARRPRARRLPGRLQGDAGGLRGVPAAAERRFAGVPRGDRDHRPPAALRAARGGRRRRRRCEGAAARAAHGHLHGRLGPAPQAVALGQAAGQPALDPAPRGPRPGLLALRRLRDRPDARARSPLPGVRAALRRDRRPHVQRLGPGPSPARGLRPRGLRGRGEGAPGSAHRRGDRSRGSPHAAGVVRDRRFTSRLRPPRAARRPAHGGREVLPAPGGAGGRLPDQPQRTNRGGPRAQWRHGGEGARARPGRPARRHHLPPRVPRERDRGGALLRARRQRRDGALRREEGAARAHGRRQGRRHVRRERRG